MSDVIDVQTAVIGQLLDLLAAVPAFGDAVREDWVAGVLDAEDSDEPERLIILQEGDTVERDRSPGSVVEEWTVNIVPMARGRTPPRRCARRAWRSSGCSRATRPG